MIHNEQKKWFLYSTLPPRINKLFIYMPTANDPKAEKALEELSEYLKTRLDTIAKVTRVDQEQEGELYGWNITFPRVIFGQDGGWIINHNLTDITKAVSNFIPVIEVEPNVEEILKALKDGKDLL